MIALEAKKAGLESLPSQRIEPHANPTSLVVVITMMLVVAVNSVAAVVVRPPSVVIRSIIWRTPIIAVIAARVVSIVPRITVVAVSVGRVTESNSYSSNPD
jgi:hypothetical protein